jgi:cellulose synthase/poly-beta-1,6-N-acetylglucosamine synthase-like glycosyltransferase
VIGQKLDAVLSLEYPRNKLQIIVSDDGSEDDTAQIVERYQSAGVELIQSSQRHGKVTVLNDAIQYARGDVVVYTDADVSCPPASLKTLVNHFADETVGCVTAGHRIEKSGSQAGRANDLYWRYESFLKVLESRIYSTVAASGHMLAVRRELVEPIPPEIIIDDFYRALTVLRQGFRVIYEPEAVCIQRPVISMADEVTRRKRITAGRIQVIAAMREFLPQLPPLARFQVFSHKFGRPFLPLMMLVALLLNPFLLVLPWPPYLPAPFHFFAVLMLVLQTLFYGLAFLGFLFDQLGWRPKFLSLPYYLVSTNLGALQGLVTYLAGKQTVLWDQAKRQ